MNEKILNVRGASPFDDSASNRLKHMGLLDSAGNVDQAATTALGRVMAGLFFNDLCDHYNEPHAVVGVYEDLKDCQSQRDYRHLLVRFSLQYDMMHQPLPAVVWWLSGTKPLSQKFLDSLMMAMGVLIEEFKSQTGLGEAF